MKKQYISPAIYSHKLCIESNVLAASPRTIPPIKAQRFGHTGFLSTDMPTDLNAKTPDFDYNDIEEATGGGWESL